MSLDVENLFSSIMPTANPKVEKPKVKNRYARFNWKEIVFHGQPMTRSEAYATFLAETKISENKDVDGDAGLFLLRLYDKVYMANQKKEATTTKEETKGKK